jgi:transposase-like protein
MSKDITKLASNILLGADWHDSIEACVGTQIRGFIELMLEAELSSVLGRARYARARAAGSPEAGEPGPEVRDGAVAPPVFGHRNGHRDRELTGTFGKTTISVPRARLEASEGGTTEWTSKTLSAYRRRTKEVEALIAGSYLAGTNTRRVGRALASLFRGSVSKDTVSRVWRKIKGDWEAWNKRDLGSEDIIRLILDGTTVRVRIDRKATTISLLIVLGVRRDGQKILLAIRSMGGESEAAWRTVLDDLAVRGLKKPELTIVDGAPGLEKALTSLWADIPIQRCTVHKLRNLIAHAPKKLAEEIAADFSDMMYAKTAKEVAARRKAFIRKWRLKCRAVADSLEEAGDKLFTFTRLPIAQWKSIRTTNAIGRLHEEFKRRIKTQTVLPVGGNSSHTVWGLFASGQITMRKVDGRETLAERPIELIDLAA